jgi:hypothetical protein
MHKARIVPPKPPGAGRAAFLAAKAGDFIAVMVNDNQLPVLKMLLMPVFMLASAMINEVSTEIAHSDLVKRHTTGARVSRSATANNNLTPTISKGSPQLDRTYG